MTDFRLEKLSKHGICGIAIFGENVERKRLRPTVDHGNGLVHGIDRDDRQNRPEDLLGHDRRVKVRVDDHGRLDVPALDIDGAAERNGAAMAVK